MKQQALLPRSNMLEISPHTPERYTDLVAAHIFRPDEVTSAIYQSALDKHAKADDICFNQIAYDSDGLRITGLMATPNPAPKKMPLLIFNRGGSFNYGALNMHLFFQMIAPFVRAGYGMLASNYRGNHRSEGREEFGGADVNDVLALIDIGKQQPWWDGQNIFMLGWSRGGMMTYIACRKRRDITAAASLAGMADLHTSAEQFPAMVTHVYSKLIPDWPISKQQAFDERSAVCWANKINTPLLLLHGDADDAVPIDRSQRLAQLLSEHNKPHRFVTYEGANHTLSPKRSLALEECQNWFEEHRR